MSPRFGLVFRIARRAGITLASVAIASSVTTTTMNVAGSFAETE